MKVRWHGMKREERACTECDNKELKDVCIWLCSALHWIIQDSYFLEAREDNLRKSNGERTVLMSLFYHPKICAVPYWSTWCPSS